MTGSESEIERASERERKKGRREREREGESERERERGRGEREQANDPDSMQMEEKGHTCERASKRADDKTCEHQSAQQRSPSTYLYQCKHKKPSVFISGARSVCCFSMNLFVPGTYVSRGRARTSFITAHRGGAGYRLVRVFALNMQSTKKNSSAPPPPPPNHNGDQVWQRTPFENKCHALAPCTRTLHSHL